MAGTSHWRAYPTKSSLLSYLLGGWQCATRGGQGQCSSPVQSDPTAGERHPKQISPPKQNSCSEEVSTDVIELAAITHDISIPLDVITGAAWSLKTGCSAEDREFWIDCILRNVLSAQNLIEDFRDDVHERIGGFKLCLEQIELSQVVREVVDDFSPLVNHLQLRFSREDAWILGDTKRIKRLVFNLLSLAAKRSATGGEIKIDVWKRGNRVCLFIQDEGCGLTVEEVEEMFSLLTSSQERHEPTSENLGLWSVKRIAEAHGATVKVQRTANQGAIFEIDFKALDLTQIPLQTQGCLK